MMMSHNLSAKTIISLAGRVNSRPWLL